MMPHCTHRHSVVQKNKLLKQVSQFPWYNVVGINDIVSTINPSGANVFQISMSAALTIAINVSMYVQTRLGATSARVTLDST